MKIVLLSILTNHEFEFKVEFEFQEFEEKKKQWRRNHLLKFLTKKLKI